MIFNPAVNSGISSTYENFFFFALFITVSLHASDCPWTKMNGSELMAFDSDNSVDKQLSSSDVKEDLECLKILFKNFYVAQITYPNIDLTGRIELEILKSKETSSLEFMKRIFKLHEGMYDIHLSYELNWEPLKFESLSKQQVSLNEELEFDEMYDRPNYIYFRPGSLVNFSTKQKYFIDTMASTDKNLVLDLRGNAGGDSKFAKGLSEAIFTSNQKIPKTTKLQVHSPLQRIGFSLSLLIHEYDVAESNRIDVANEVSDLSFTQLLPFQIASRTEEIKGKRTNAFKSKIVLITDSGCASDCETIVEKISAHPNAKVIGANTNGALHFSNAITFMLPNSGIVVKLPTLLHQYENDAPEGLGYKPNEQLEFIDLNSIFN
jgi:hypothetical protein